MEKLSREATREAACPKCGALPGKPCTGRRGPRKSNHIERVEAADPLGNLTLEQLRKLPYETYLETPHWRKLAARVKARANGRCEHCSELSRLDAHHKTYERLGQELMEDLEALCRSCHAQRHGRNELTVEGVWLRTTDGRIVGRVVEVVIDMPAENVSPPTPPISLSSLPVEGKTTQDKGERRGTGTGITTEMWTVFNRWLEIADPRSREFTPSRQRLIQKVLREASVEDCLFALDGLVNWQQQRGGSLELSRVFQTRPGGSPLREQLDFWIGQAGDVSAGASSVTSEQMVRINRAKEAVIRAHDMPSEQAEKQAYEATNYLTGEGWTIDKDEQGRPTFRAP